MGNSKTFQAARKHRKKKRAARHKVSEFLRSKGGDASKRPMTTEAVTIARRKMS